MLETMTRPFTLLILFVIVFFTFPIGKQVQAQNVLTLDETMTKVDLHPYIEIVKDRKLEWTIDEVTTDHFSSHFTPLEAIEQKSGFFQTGNWLRIHVYNRSIENDWLLEFAFPLIHEITIYTVENNQVSLLYDTGSDYPFHDRDIAHRNFVFDLKMKQGEQKTYYIWAVGSGDLHPAINIWEKKCVYRKITTRIYVTWNFLRYFCRDDTV